MPSMRTPVRRKIKRKLCKVCNKYTNPKQFDPADRICGCNEVGGSRIGQKHLFLLDKDKEDFDEEWIHNANILGLNPFVVAQKEHGRPAEWVEERFGWPIYYGEF